ncbi:glycosyltransferase, partial [Streptomyces mirabilis]|uniref:glycosyltransferase n=1 Tax=Streptomyces mirabilis TaxID=68239 RepID=UPI0033B7AE8F
MTYGFSVLILTKNEEADLPGCLKSIDGVDDIWVLDSISEDNTVQIANAFGAHVVAREFDGFAAAVIGGCLLTGGYGSAIGPVFGAFMFGMVN